MTPDRTDLERTEARLRAAVGARTADVPEPDAAVTLAAIERRLSAARRRRTLERVGGGVLAAAAAVAAVLGLATVVGDDGPDQVRTTDRPTTTTTTTTPPATTTSVAPDLGSQSADAIWPPPNHEQYADPQGAARSFVQEFVGFPDPPLSAFRPTSGADGEVDVHLVGEGGGVRRDRVVSTVLLRQAPDGWKVIGARSPDIEVDTPRHLDTVGGLFVAEGRSRGYEGTISVVVVEAGATARRPLVQVTGIGGAGAELEPFHLDVVIDPPPSLPAGALLFTTDTGCSACNTAFAAVPIRLGMATLETTPAAPPASEAGLTDETPLRFDGIGPVTIGMTLDEATAALRGPVRLQEQLLLEPATAALCGYARANGGPQGLLFMVTRDRPADPWRINRIDVEQESRVATEAGIRTGDTAAAVRRAYEQPSMALSIAPHPYLGTAGSYLSVVRDGANGLLLLFETEDGRVLRYRSGREAEVRYIEGCA